MKKFFSVFLGLVFLVAIIVLSNRSIPDPFTVSLNGALPSITIDEMIYRSELILIGEVETILPSKWNSSKDINTRYLTPKDVGELGVGMYTDTIITPISFLKGDLPEDFILRVRSFGGTIEHVTFENLMSPSFQEGQKYLLFLYKDTGTTQIIDPGDYIPINAGFGVYEIIGDTVVSLGDERSLDELVTYIEDSRWALSEPNIPENEDAQEIIEIVEKMYVVETKAGYDFLTEDFSSVFISDSRFTLLPEKVEYTKYFTDVPSLNLFGYLDYKIAYYIWWQNGASQYEAIQAKATSENREVSSEELRTVTNSEWAKKWGLPSVREESPVREHFLQVTSIEIGSEFTTVYLFDGHELVELYLVKIDSRWFVAGEKDVTTKPDMSFVDSPIEEPIVTTNTPSFTPTPAELLKETPLPEETPTVMP